MLGTYTCLERKRNKECVCVCVYVRVCEAKASPAESHGRRLLNNCYNDLSLGKYKPIFPHVYFA